jgi:hypothetical protein
LTLFGKFFGKLQNRFSGNSLPMLVRLLWNVGLVVYIDRDTLAFFEAKDKTRKLVVVGSSDTMCFGVRFDWFGGDSLPIGS